MSGRGRRGSSWFGRVQIGSSRPGAHELHDLEALSDANIQEWQDFADAQTRYQYALYYELEAQRASSKNELCEALRNVAATQVCVDGWYRAVNFRYGREGLSPAGSLAWVGGRFNVGREVDAARFPPFPALYVAEDFETAYREYFQLPSGDSSRGLVPEELALDRMGSWVALKLQGQVNQVFDLTRARNLAGFAKIIGKFTVSDRIREAEREASREPTRLARTPRDSLDVIMHENWNVLPVHFDLPSNSQIFARLLVDAGFEGVLYKSSKHSKRCMAVFTRQLVNSESAIHLHPDHPPDLSFCKLDSSNCLVV